MTRPSPGIFILTAALLSLAQVACSARPRTLCEPTVPDERSCDLHCNTVHGKIAWLNVPWTFGKCVGKVCTCMFNERDTRYYIGAGNNICFYWYTLDQKKQNFGAFIEGMIAMLSLDKRFDMYTRNYRKRYNNSTERKKRFEIFKKNLTEIRRLMANRKNPNLVYGVNPFTDLSREEFTKLYIGKVGDSANPKSSTRKSSFFRKKTLSKKGSQRTLSKKGSQRTLSKKGSQKTPSRQGSFRGSSCETPRYPSFRSGGRTPSSGGTPSIGRGARTPPHPFIGMEDPTGGNTSGLIYREPQGVVMHDWRMPPWLYPPAENQNTFYLTCHSCWAFASLAAVEILVAEEVGGVVMLSKQGEYALPHWRAH
nr:PREDICTED: uncharacterized protein LOC109037657 [Bemisia tabaci]